MISLDLVVLPYGETTAYSETTMLENQLIDAFGPKFREFASRVGGTVRNIQKEPVRSGPDLLVQAEIRGTPITLIAEAKSQGRGSRSSF